MEVLYFLKERTKFIRYFYKQAERPFFDIKSQIENAEPPFDHPPYSENGEPPFLEEWIQADEALDVLGRSCLSMLSPSLRLYFSTWERELGIRWEKAERRRAFASGFLRGYMYCFEEVVNISWDKCPADLGMIEQITLARNRDQHPESITSMTVHHAEKDLEKYPHPFFINGIESKMYSDPGFEGRFLISPSIRVTRQSLFAAILEVEKLAEWLEEPIHAFKYGRLGAGR